MLITRHKLCNKMYIFVSNYYLNHDWGKNLPHASDGVTEVSASDRGLKS